MLTLNALELLILTCVRYVRTLCSVRHCGPDIYISRTYNDITFYFLNRKKEKAQKLLKQLIWASFRCF
jgi:hypothetical protein